MRAFSPEEKETVRRAQREGAPLVCPTCRVALDERPVRPGRAVAYVRARTVVTCPSCHGHLVLDRSER